MSKNSFITTPNSILSKNMKKWNLYYANYKNKWIKSKLLWTKQISGKLIKSTIGQDSESEPNPLLFNWGIKALFKWILKTFVSWSISLNFTNNGFHFVPALKLLINPVL